MSLKINLEIGHEATLRAKNTQEGFTHDWKIFVRGCEGANIQHYVEKVVFYLHETFQKPRRVLKEPPYFVKESGYAGFIVPIEIYLRTAGEPKKIKFSYDLSLQRAGPPIRKVKREKYVFTTPPDDLRDKLLKGGATVPSNSQESSEGKSVFHEEKNQLISKPKLSGESPTKRPKFDPPLSNTFQDLFGTPITKTSKPPEPKAASGPSPKESKSSSKPDKDRSVDKQKNKHSPQKDKDREKDKTERKEKKEEKKRDREKRDKDRERNKEKASKMDRSPKPGPSSSPKDSKPNSPAPNSSQGSSNDNRRDKDAKNEKDKKGEEEKKVRKEKKEKDKEKHRDGSKSEAKNKETRSRDTSSQVSDAVASTSHLPPEPKDDTRDTERKDKSEEKEHEHEKKDKKKERRDEEEKKTSPKQEKDNSPESSVQLVSNTSSSPQSEMSGTNDFFIDSPQPGPSTSHHGEAQAAMYTSRPDEYSETSSSSRCLSPMEADLAEGYSGLSDSARKRKRANSPDIEESPTKLRRGDRNPVPGDADMPSEDRGDENRDPENMEGVTFPYTTYDPVTGQEIEHYIMEEEELIMLLGLKDRINACRGTPLMEKVVDIVSDTGNFELTETFDFNLSELDQDTIADLMALLPPPTPPTSASPESSPQDSPPLSPPPSPPQSPAESPVQSVSPSPTRSESPESPSRSPSRSPSPSPSRSPSPPL